MAFTGAEGPANSWAIHRSGLRRSKLRPSQQEVNLSRGTPLTPQAGFEQQSQPTPKRKAAAKATKRVFSFLHVACEIIGFPDSFRRAP